jgi:hypothetical protein
MSPLNPMPAFEDYYKVCLKDDREAKAVPNVC